MDWRHADNPRPFTWTHLAQDERPMATDERRHAMDTLHRLSVEAGKLSVECRRPDAERGYVVDRLTDIQDSVSRMLRLILSYAVAADEQRDAQARAAEVPWPDDVSSSP